MHRLPDKLNSNRGRDILIGIAGLSVALGSTACSAASPGPQPTPAASTSEHPGPHTTTVTGIRYHDGVADITVTGTRDYYRVDCEDGIVSEREISSQYVESLGLPPYQFPDVHACLNGSIDQADSLARVGQPLDYVWTVEGDRDLDLNQAHG